MGSDNTFLADGKSHLNQFVDFAIGESAALETALRIQDKESDLSLRLKETRKTQSSGSARGRKYRRKSLRSIRKQLGRNAEHKKTFNVDYILEANASPSVDTRFRAALDATGGVAKSVVAAELKELYTAHKALREAAGTNNRTAWLDAYSRHSEALSAVFPFCPRAKKKRRRKLAIKTQEIIDYCRDGRSITWMQERTGESVGNIRQIRHRYKKKIAANPPE